MAIEDIKSPEEIDNVIDSREKAEVVDGLKASISYLAEEIDKGSPAWDLVGIATALSYVSEYEKRLKRLGVIDG